MMHNGNSNGDSSEDPFRKGAQVEVCFEEEGFRGSWYAATVIRPPPKRTSKNSRIFLQFHTLAAAGEGESPTTSSNSTTTSTFKPLCEAVDVILVRPTPPRESRRRFHVSEDVDAFHNDGWWEGIVIAVLDGARHYSVYFRSSREQIDFPESQLRLHREWVHGKWSPPLEDEAEDDDCNVPPQAVATARTSRH